MRGFTLLELLIAMAVFAVLAVMAYGGLDSVVNSAARVRQQATELGRLQSAMLFLGRDLSQAAGRGMRDQYGDSQPALVGGGDDDAGLSFTREGWANPTDVARSRLQRIDYGVRDGELQRLSWRVLDRAQDSKPYRSTLLSGIKTMRLRFLDGGRAWQDSWPPPVRGGGVAANPDRLPLVVEVTLELEHWGTITRLFPLAEGAP